MQNRAAKREAHFGVVGDAAFFQLQPAAADDVTVDTVLVFYFTRRHELDGCAKRITDGQTGIRRSGSQFQCFRIVRYFDE
jgi:hypothetical protein